MLFTHHFAHPEALARARHWLESVGFPASRIKVHTEGTPRLTLRAAPTQRAVLSLVFHTAERSDPEGWPSFWQHASRGLAGQIHAAGPPPDGAASAPDAPRRPHRNVVGWHPTPPDILDPEAAAVRDRYWS